MGEPDQDVTEFIEQSIQSLQGADPEPRFDERVLQAPLAVLQPRPALLVEPQTSVLESVGLMQAQGGGCVLVVRSRKLKGIFTERDLLTRVVGKGVDPGKTPVRRVMTPSPEYLRITDPVAHALNKMSIGGYRHVPIVDKAMVATAVVTAGDVISYLVRFFPKSVLNLPAFPRANYAREREGA